MQKKDRITVHSDINYCYAQIEKMKYPGLRDVPVAVGGNEEKRHGIILAKNDKAKAFHIKIGESLREALAKCPQLHILKPDYEGCMYYTERVKDVCYEYMDKVGSFGSDGAWIDLSESAALFGDGIGVAREVQNRVEYELEMMVSVGVSYNKIFAKIESDMDKHKGLVEIIRENYCGRIWPLPTQDLFYVGRATKHKPTHYSVKTVGQLAQFPQGQMKDRFGKVGELIRWFVNGEDASEVILPSHQEQAKSVGNAITTPKDIKNFEDAKIVYYVFAESVASRLREQGFRGSVISVTPRSTELTWSSRQRKLTQAINIVTEIMPMILSLLEKNHDFSTPLCMTGIALDGIEKGNGTTQLNLLVNEEERHRQRMLEKTMDAIRGHFGFPKIQHCSLLKDRHLTDLNPKEDHAVHPVDLFWGSLCRGCMNQDSVHTRNMQMYQPLQEEMKY